MTADEFVKIIRNGFEKLRVDEIVINTGSQQLHGKGMIRISRERVELDVTINEGEMLPEFHTGIYTKRDSWKLTGLIEDQLQFKCDHVGPAQLFSMEQMCQAVANHFGLKWQDDMENIFKTWKRARNPLLHEKARAEMSEDEQKASVINESRIAGAINILLLKLFGYSGQMRHSTFEDGYREI